MFLFTPQTLTADSLYGRHNSTDTKTVLFIESYKNTSKLLFPLPLLVQSKSGEEQAGSGDRQQGAGMRGEGAAAGQG